MGKVFATFILCFLPFVFFSQNGSTIANKDTLGQSGVFLSVNEFQEKSPSLPIYLYKGERLLFSFPRGLGNLKAEKKDTVIVQTFSQIVIKKKAGKLIYKIKHGSVYGYCYTGKCYRYFSSKSWRINDGYYKIEEEGPLIIYSKRKMNRTFSSVHYYYSLTLNSPLNILTTKNVESDLKNKPDVFNKIKHNEKLMKNIILKDDDGKFLLNKMIADSE